MIFVKGIRTRSFSTNPPVKQAFNIKPLPFKRMQIDRRKLKDAEIIKDNTQINNSSQNSLLDQKVTRREAMSTGAKAGIGIAAVVIVGAAGYLAYTSLAGTSSSSTSSTTTSSSGSSSSISSTSAVSVNTNLTPLTFVHWHYRDDRVTGYINAFIQENNENVIQETLDNANYNPLIEAKFQSGETFDMNYANAFEAFRLIRLGNTKNVEGMTNISQIKSEMYPAIVQAYSDANNNLAGLPYFWSARSAPVVNDVILNAAGLNGQRPQTWDDLWSMATTVKSKGAAQYPVLPHWFNANYGIMWDFQGELGNVNNDPDLTSTFFDKNFTPIFDTNTAVADLLTKWQTATKSGLVDPAIFSMGGDDPFVTASETGKYAFVPTAVYYFKSMNDPTTSKIPVGSANITPVTKQAWGVIDSGLYCWPVKNHDDTRSQALIKHLGYKDSKTGQRVTQPAWAETDALFSGYTDTLQDPNVIAAYKAWLGDRTTDTLKIFNDIAAGFTRPHIWKSPLYTPYADQAFPILGAVASGTTDVKTGVTQLRQAADTLSKQYSSSS